MADDTQNPNVAPVSPAASTTSAPVATNSTSVSSGVPTASPDTAGNGEGSNGPAATAATTATALVIKQEHKDGFFNRLEHVPAEILRDIVKAFEALEADIKAKPAA